MKINVNNTARKRLLLALLGGLIISLMLCSCSGCDSCVQGCAQLQSCYYPELAAGEGDAVPVIAHSPSAEEVNAQLEEYFSPVNALVDKANEGRDIFSLEHKLTARDGCYYLSSAILCQPGGRLELPEIYIPYFGQAVMPEPESLWLPDDPQAIAAWLELKCGGFDTDLSRLEETVTMAELCDMYAGYYVQVSGIEPDTSRFADTVECAQAAKEAYVLGLCDGLYQGDDEYDSDYVFHGYYHHSEAEEYDLTVALYGLLESMYNDACGAGSTGFTRTELLECVRLFAQLDYYSQNNWSRSANLIVRLCDERLAACPKGDDIQLSRQEIAEVLVELYEEMYGKASVPSYIRNNMEDTQEESCLKASALWIMEDFPTSYVFSPQYIPGMGELPEFISQFLSACRSADLEMSGDYDYETRIMTYRDILLALSAVDISVRSVGLCEDEPTIVINDREYDWYYTQHGTGRYSSVNCMPTIAMMATKWYDEDTTVTIEEMRRRYLPDYTGGWYTWQVLECLETNGVPSYLATLDEDKLRYLDNGCIILSQMSEASENASGHCFLIYGYWKRGDTIKYYIHDPDVYDGTDDYGQRPGYAMVLDSHYSDWIIERIAIGYIAAGNAVNELVTDGEDAEAVG